LWVLSLGGLALLARSLLGEPPPLWLAVTALLVYVVLATLGVIFPQLEMYGDVIWRGTSDVALTFDDGPHPRTTRRVLRLLAERGQRATFFVVGRKVALYPDVVREIHEAGHALGLHGYLHDRLFSFRSPESVRADIERTQRAVEAACGQRPTLFRPPIGHVSSRTARGARLAGVTLVAWSLRVFDGVGKPSPERVLARVARGLRPGAIVLLHDASEREDFEPTSIDALPRILDLIAERGLRCLGVDELDVGDREASEGDVQHTRDAEGDQQRQHAERHGE
jgi:peptidoglycan/xylan/chitin deacetylase (PgdA/CDA1 family)